MKLVTYKLIPCPGCNEQGQVKVVDSSDRELGTYPCPTCKFSIRPGYIIVKAEEEKDHA